MMTCDVTGKSLQHFATLAKRGKAAGASSGEKRCRRIAKALLDNCPGLDGQALEGAATFVRVALDHPETARDILDLWD